MESLHYKGSVEDDLEALPPNYSFVQHLAPLAWQMFRQAFCGQVEPVRACAATMELVTEAAEERLPDTGSVDEYKGGHAACEACPCQLDSMRSWPGHFHIAPLCRRECASCAAQNAQLALTCCLGTAWSSQPPNQQALRCRLT